MKPRLESVAGIFTPRRCLRVAVSIVVLYLIGLILSPFPHYLPPDFDQGFLANKKHFFFSSGYFLGFYAHIVSSPVALACGTLQLSRTLRSRWPHMHRALGKVYIALVLCLAAPGGAIMAMRAFGGWPSMVCFGLISALAWAFTWIAWRRAKSMRYAEHGLWMCRSYVMMSSAILLRLSHYLIQPLNLDPTLAYQLAAWLSWVPAIAVLELAYWVSRHSVGRSAQNSETLDSTLDEVARAKSLSQ
jgi:uncharacterized membrane protein